jgi:lipopolysaccharide transport system ATP-binding protein
MSDIVIRAEGLGKRYRRGLTGPPEMLRDVLTRIMKSPVAAMRRPTQEYFWALRDVGLEVRQGEVLGLIGRNGAGKTTLLKILSRITRPTTGWADIHGRVRSLLEVGTGFHGELSGRENTYLSGSILGMGKREIDRKFDEIVAFAEVDKFIDTPVKHYSSGMYVRLAFAVAAHLEPEILLVDEVLAVGDINFQKKCLGKMGDVAKTGRTIVLVSHQMAAINALASRVILMKRGIIDFDGSSVAATSRYYADSLGPMQNQSDLLLCAREGEGQAKFSSIVIQPLDSEGGHVPVAYPGCNLSIELEIECYSSISESLAAVIIYDQTGYRVVDVNTAQKNDYVRLNAGEKAKVSFLVRDLLLKPGEYYIGLWLGQHGVGAIDHIEHSASLSVMEGEENQHYVIYPGVYVCRFEENISVLQASPATGANCDLRPA